MMAEILSPHRALLNGSGLCVYLVTVRKEMGRTR